MFRKPYLHHLTLDGFQILDGIQMLDGFKYLMDSKELGLKICLKLAKISGLKFMFKKRYLHHVILDAFQILDGFQYFMNSKE